MTEEELLARLLFDLSNLNLPVGEVDVSLRPFSKTYYGRYFHVQYTSGSFSRVRGVMHDTQFWQLYNHYCKRAVNKEIMGGDSFECKEI